MGCWVDRRMDLPPFRARDVSPQADAHGSKALGPWTPAGSDPARRESEGRPLHPASQKAVCFCSPDIT